MLQKEEKRCILNDSGKNLHTEDAKTRCRHKNLKTSQIIFAIILGISQINKMIKECLVLYNM